MHQQAKQTTKKYNRLENITKSRLREKLKYNNISGEFPKMYWKIINETNKCVRGLGLDESRNRGEILYDFVIRERLHYVSTFFK